MARPLTTRLRGLVGDTLGPLMATSPWLFGFAPTVCAPHVMLGLLELCLVAMSQAGPPDDPGRSTRPDRPMPGPRRYGVMPRRDMSVPHGVADAI